MSDQTPPEGVKVIKWDNWELYPTWKTEKQLREMGLQAWEKPVGAVWYTNKYLHRRGLGHWLLLYDQTLARPKEISDQKRAAVEKAKQTALLNRTCSFCNRLALRKIDHPDRLCNRCERLQKCCSAAQRWLAMPNAVIMDFETTGLRPGRDEIIQIVIVDMQGNILLDTYLKPMHPIDESIPEPDPHDSDYYSYRPTAFEINGISNETVKDAPTFSELYPRLRDILAGKYVIAFNVDFEASMLRGELIRRALPGQTLAGWGDAMIWYSEYVGDWNHRKHDYTYINLDDACSMNGVSVDAPAHSGAGDCMRTLALIKAIASKPHPNTGKDSYELQYD